MTRERAGSKASHRQSAEREQDCGNDCSYPFYRQNADQILVVSDGKIAEAGTHDELLAKGGKYAAMWNAEQKLSA